MKCHLCNCVFLLVPEFKTHLKEELAHLDAAGRWLEEAQRLLIKSAMQVYPADALFTELFEGEPNAPRPVA